MFFQVLFLTIGLTCISAETVESTGDQAAPPQAESGKPASQGEETEVLYDDDSM
jgi:hypothetical protein